MSSGRTKTITDEKIIETVVQHPDKCVTAVELSEKLDMSSTGILNRLNDLNDEGMIHKKKVGGRAVVWWVEG